MNKRILSLVLTLVLALSLTTPAMAATKASTKTIKFQAGTNTAEGWSGDATIKVTNVTKQETKDFSTKLSDGSKSYTFAGEKSKVIYCKASTTITLVPNKGEKSAAVFGLNLISDVKTAKSIKLNFKYYELFTEYEGVGEEKLTEAPENFVIADSSSFTLKKAGTYVLYVQPFGFYGTEENGDFELNPVFIVVK